MKQLQKICYLRLNEKQLQKKSLNEKQQLDEKK